MNVINIKTSLQTLMMMIGEVLCLGVYFFMKYVVHREDPEAYDNTSKSVSPFIMLPVTKRNIKFFYLAEHFRPAYLTLHQCHSALLVLDF